MARNPKTPWEIAPRRLNSFPKKLHEPLVGPGALAFEQELASFIARCIAQCSTVEAELGLLLVRLLGSNAQAGLAMFSRLRSAQAQFDAIQGAASVSFPPKHAYLLNAVFKLVGKARNARNELAHNLWFRNPRIPGALIMMNPADLSDILVRFDQFTEKLDGDNKPAMAEMPSHDPNRILVYFRDDFAALLQLFTATAGCTRLLTELVSSVGPEREEVAERLRIQPALEAILAQEKHRQALPPPPAQAQSKTPTGARKTERLAPT